MKLGKKVVISYRSRRARISQCVTPVVAEQPRAALLCDAASTGHRAKMGSDFLVDKNDVSKVML